MTTSNPLVTRVAVFGNDDRQSLPDAYAGLGDKIGTLALRDSNICSAFCVADDAIATASHCLFGTAQSPPPALTDLVFKVGRGAMAQASRLAGNGQSAIQRNIRSGTRRLRVTPPIDAANDWAIARLAEPVCRAGGLALSPLSREEVSLRAEAGGVFQVAMHRDVSPGGVVWGGPCSFARSFPQASEQTIEHDFADAPSILMHTCDTGAGSSGSPLLIDGANGPEVVGLNVGTYVLSRTSSSSSTQGGEDKSRPITNTAIETARFRPAAETFTLATSALGDDRTERRDAKAAAAKGRLAR